MNLNLELNDNDLYLAVFMFTRQLSEQSRNVQKAESILLPGFYVKPLMTAVKAITICMTRPRFTPETHSLPFPLKQQW